MSKYKQYSHVIAELRKRFLETVECVDKDLGNLTWDEKQDMWKKARMIASKIHDFDESMFTAISRNERKSKQLISVEEVEKEEE